MEYEKLNIYCPRCRRKCHTHDGRGTLYVQKKCNNCNKLVVYNPKTKETMLKPLPERVCSSGMRFY